MKGHYQGLTKLNRDFDSAQWNENHTALLNDLKEEYRSKSAGLLVEGQTSWRVDGRTATVAGKMDLITINPNLIIDAKTGKRKDAHVMQMKIYLLAAQRGAVKGVSGIAKAVLRYTNSPTVEVFSCDDVFKKRFFDLVVRLAGPELEPVPSLNECKFCDLADCKVRAEENPAVKVDEF